ncbi:unnamed protein product [Rotaria sp. Silwood1]|nr:unnamed protein product [Rotaria sp. Silwood1]CAF0770325.1 unnamed protein product [Rotaria sp. Silwood1]CAF3321312.1 unnamed protein product [Rotaria sp. Silwood1]CAF4757366.1 unnamed protein product [Rotaria sp. Silwood1]
MASNSIKQNEWYTISCGNFTFTLPIRYQDLVPIGQKTHTIVVRATDITTGKHVTIKKLLHPFQTHIYAKRTYLELKLLMYLNHPDAQLAQLYNVFTPEQTVKDFQTLYLVLNFVDYDLHRVIASYEPMTEELIKLIIYSLLRGLKFIQSAGIIVRNLKPTNIGVDRNSNVTILDFGLARIAPIGSDMDCFVTKLWCAPEIYLNEIICDEKVDLWSVGCIMAELILRKPLFLGYNTIDQLNKIFDIIGTPNSTTLQEICTPEASAYINRMKPIVKKNFNELFGFKYDPLTKNTISGVSPEGVDLLEHLLSFDPRQRPTVEQALSHRFLEFYHDPMDEPTIEPMIDEHEDAVYSKEQWKSIVWQMVQEFSPPLWINDDSMNDS